MADEGFQWRFVMTDLDSVTLSFLERLASQRTVTPTLNKPTVAGGVVPSDNPEVNIVHTDGFPFLSANNRLLFGFRREGAPTDWVCRQSGIIAQIDDSVQTDQPYSRYTAYDPWQYCYSLPCLLDGSPPTLPTATGMSALPAETATEFIVRLLTNFNAYATAQGDPHPEAYIDIVSGTLEATAVIYPFTVQQGTSIGEAFDQIVATGKCDIMMRPIYDPVSRPGILSELNVYVEAGVDNGFTMSWDGFPYSLVGIDRLHDGTQQANIVQYYKGQGGAAVTPQIDAPSVATYGEYWAQQFFPSQAEATGVIKFAEAQLQARAEPGRSGITPITVMPSPAPAAVPFTDYYLGDSLDVFASDNLRQVLGAALRVYSIPVVIGDDGLERVDNLLFATGPSS